MAIASTGPVFIGARITGWDVNANFFAPTITLVGVTSGTATIGVASIAGTPNPMNLPIATGTSGSVLTTDGGSPQQLSWTPAGFVPSAVLTAATPTTTTGQVGLGTTTSTSATAGSNGDVPAQVVGYLEIDIAGTKYKVPYYAV